MVNTFRRTVLATFACSQILLSAAAKDLAEYRVGDKLVEDIATPVPLMVVDPAATEALKDKESQRIPVIFRFDKTAATLVEADMRETFSLAQSNFVRLMHSSFHHTKLEEDQLDSEQFGKLVESFKKQNKAFPLTRMLAEDWALGSDGTGAQVTLFTRVRAAMEQPIRYDNLTNAPKIGSQVLLVPVKGSYENISVDEVNARGTRAFKTNLLTMSRARIALLEKFNADEEDTARFAARSLRVNCYVESELTLAARARHTDALFVADKYQAGQVVAKNGQLVDRKIMAALSEMQEKTVAGRLQQQVSQEKVQVAQARESNRWLIIALAAAGTILLATLAWLAFHRKSATSMLPVVMGGNVSADSRDVSDTWQQRAIAAEEKVAKAHDAIRSGMVAQLKDKAVSSLVAQRSDMMNAQQAAAAEMADLERRLSELHAPLQDRLRTYENKITDLEKALEAKGEENRELIRAKIELMRKQLEAECKGSTLQFN